MEPFFTTDRMSVEEYLRTPETARRVELIDGLLREPPAPTWEHQRVVARLAGALERHLQRAGTGEVGLAPLDVVLDRGRAIVLQPDIVVVTTRRAGLVRDQVWGPPDLVVEVLSPGTRRFDQREKMEIYREHGVAECWIVDPIVLTITVHRLPAGGYSVFAAGATLRSRVLPRLRLKVATAFG